MLEPKGNPKKDNQGKVTGSKIKTGISWAVAIPAQGKKSASKQNDDISQMAQISNALVAENNRLKCEHQELRAELPQLRK